MTFDLMTFDPYMSFLLRQVTQKLEVLPTGWLVAMVGWYIDITPH